jgi:glucose-1-phosphate adenylyltransferase
LPGSIIEETNIHRAIISDGCIIHGARIERSVIGIRSVIHPNTTIKNTIMMGADFYESEYQEVSESLYPLGIGSHCHIENAIIDKNARIGNHVTIIPHDQERDSEGPGYEVRDGIVIILKNAVIPSGTTI